MYVCMYVSHISASITLPFLLLVLIPVLVQLPLLRLLPVLLNASAAPVAAAAAFAAVLSISKHIFSYFFPYLLVLSC